jgi:hypothetical protein
MTGQGYNGASKGTTAVRLKLIYTKKLTALYNGYRLELRWIQVAETPTDLLRCIFFSEKSQVYIDVNLWYIHNDTISNECYLRLYGALWE